MNKPVPMPRQSILNYNDIIAFIEEKYLMQTRDVNNSHRHFFDWCDAHDLPITDSEGKHRSSSQKFYAMYNAAPDGGSACPEYLDFWHWMIDEHWYGEIHNPCDTTIDFYEILDDSESPDWVKKIIDIIRIEFGEYADDDSILYVHISW